jgi:hypothetical protein
MRLAPALAFLDRAHGHADYLKHGIRLRQHWNVIGMSREDYFIVQRVYLGWNRVAYLFLIELAGMLAVIFLYRAQPSVLWPTLISLSCLVAAQVIFWVFTFPTNQATSNWSQQPVSWETLRWQWEYSHLAGAAFQTLAMAALIVAVLRRNRQKCLGVDVGRPPR